LCYSVDATNTMAYGKLVNDSPNPSSNSKMKREVVQGNVHLCLYATIDIPKDTELR